MHLFSSTHTHTPHILTVTLSHYAVLVYTGMCGMKRLTVRTHTPLTDVAFEKVADRVFSNVRDAQERNSNPSSLLSVPLGDFSASLSGTDSLFLTSLLGEMGRPASDLSATRRHLLPNVSCSFFQPSTSYSNIPKTHFKFSNIKNGLKLRLSCKPWDVMGQ